MWRMIWNYFFFDHWKLWSYTKVTYLWHLLAGCNFCLYCVTEAKEIPYASVYRSQWGTSRVRRAQISLPMKLPGVSINLRNSTHRCFLCSMSNWIAKLCHQSSVGVGEKKFKSLGDKCTAEMVIVVGEQKHWVRGKFLYLLVPFYEGRFSTSCVISSVKHRSNHWSSCCFWPSKKCQVPDVCGIDAAQFMKGDLASGWPPQVI